MQDDNVSNQVDTNGTDYDDFFYELLAEQRY